MLIDVVPCTECKYYDYCTRYVRFYDNLWVDYSHRPVNWCSNGERKSKETTYLDKHRTAKHICV